MASFPIDIHPYPAYKPSGVEWLGDVPEHWDVRRGKALLCPVDIRSKTGNEELLTVSARRWRITVGPDGDGQVAITLPVTTDCAVEGAICTGDGRMLSNELVLTVSGPAQ